MRTAVIRNRKVEQICALCIRYALGVFAFSAPDLDSRPEMGAMLTRLGHERE